MANGWSSDDGLLNHEDSFCARHAWEQSTMPSLQTLLMGSIPLLCSECYGPTVHGNGSRSLPPRRTEHGIPLPFCDTEGPAHESRPNTVAANNQSPVYAQALATHTIMRHHAQEAGWQGTE